MEHNDALEKMAKALLEKNPLNYDDVEKMIGPPPHGKKYLVSPLDFEQRINTQKWAVNRLKECEIWSWYNL